MTSPKDRRKVTTTAYLTPEQDERLRRLVKATGKPAAAFIRDGIERILTDEEVRFAVELAKLTTS